MYKKEIQERWRNKNPDYMKDYYANNKDKVKETQKQYYERNKKHLLAKSIEYGKDNKDSKAEYDRKRYAENKNKIIKQNMEYTKKRCKLDPSYKISLNLRHRLNKVLKGKLKSVSAIRDLGCSVVELKQHLEQKFYSNPETNEYMSWENYGYYGWHIDHIKPLSSFDLTDREQLLNACHYTNLQPMWAKENIKKGNKV